MRNGSRYSRRHVLGAGALLALAGCGGPSGKGGAPGSAGSGGSGTGDLLTVATADDVKSLDPALANDTWSTSVVHACTRRLVDYDRDAKLVGDLAEKWDVGDGGKSYTFRLKPGIKFADGTPIEAKHFKTAVDRVRDPKTASPGASFYGGIASVEAPDAGTLVVRLKAPDPTLVNVMGMTFAAPLPEGADPAKLPSSGPYVLDQYEAGSRVALRRNPNDPQAGGWVERIALQLRVEEALQTTRFQNGEVDLLPSVPAVELGRALGQPEGRSGVVQGVVNQTWYFGMNTSRPPWNNPKVRRAALLAMSRLRHVQLAGFGQLANGVLPPHVPGYSAERTLPDQDAAAARRLLAEAGFPSGIPKDQATTMWLANNERYQRHAEAIQSDLAEVGIPIVLRPVTFSEYLSGYRKQADCWFGGWYPDFPDAGNFLEPVLHGKSVPPNGSNAARYDNPRVNQLLDRAHGTPLGPEREALYRQAEDQILEDLPWIPLYFEVEARYHRPGVTGVVVHPVWRQVLTGISKS